MALELDTELMASTLVHTALNSLPEEQRKLIEHFYFGEEHPSKQTYRLAPHAPTKWDKRKACQRPLTNPEIEERLAEALQKLQDWFLDELGLTYHNLV